MSEIAAEVVSSGNATEAPASVDSVSNFSFNSVHDKALAMLNGETGTQEAAAGAAVTEQPAVVAGAAENKTAENVDNATSQQLAQLKDTDLVEVTVDGKPVQMPWAEAKGGVMRQAHYTREMQKLRKEQEQLTASRPQFETAVKERDALVAVLKDENLLRQVIQAKFPHLLAQAKEQAIAQAAGTPGVEADDIATVGQVESVAKRYQENVEKVVADFQKQLEAKAEAITQTIEDRQATFKLSQEINTTITGLKEAHPYMEKVVPNFEQVLRYNVAQLKPSTPEETLEAFKTVFGGMVENFKAAVADTTKATVIQKTALLNNNIQPPGGAAVTPQPTSFKKTNNLTGKTELDWTKLHEAGLSMLKK